MAKLNKATIEQHAITTREGKCFYGDKHPDCVVTEYTTAESTMGGKAHRYYYSHHSAVDAVLGSSLPGCGSRNRSWTGHGQFSDKVTCARC